MPLIVENMASLIGSMADEGDTLRQLIYPTKRSRSNKHNTSPRATGVTEKRRRNEVVRFFMYRQSRQSHRRIGEGLESETDSEESQDDEGDLDGEGIDTSGDENAGEEEEQPKPTTFSSGIPPAGTSPIESVKPGIDSPVALVSGTINPLPPANTSPSETEKPGIDSPKTSGSGTINPSPTNSANSSPSKGGLDSSNPTHLAVLMTGIVVVVFFIFLATCVMIRPKKQRHPGGIYSRYQGLRLNLGLASGYHKAPVIKNTSMKTTGKPYWDVESASKNRIPLLSGRNCTTLKRNTLLYFGKPSLEQSQASLTSSPDLNLSCYEATIPLLGSQRSPTLLAKGQENEHAQDILPSGFTSKFSRTNASATNTHTRSSVHTPNALHYTPRVDESDAVTVLTEDTEPIRFRSTTSWVLQQ
ncbi:hypothetical protein BDDG_01889 [Blastomyces dermatitidis ATCC 18188]|uniref:Uncharacterized protein n=1 Tax=Ajellomyces dermatitidis (strain ATCC 18188 / CBS 674.68) TaxID=653446 RepID=F2T672_AJEDA|nr:hypothetical protein BDDG_01889 [Blastomyces dermatitidis ATCC 18188]